MKFAALLRGINVGGNTLIKMAELKAAIEQAGFTNVRTYIASGNLVFESTQKNATDLEIVFERAIEKRFKLPVRVVVLSHEEMRQVLHNVPKRWRTGSDLRCYIAFLKKPLKASDVMGEMEPKEGVDFVVPGNGVVYMGTLLTGITKSGINKIIGKNIYKSMTMRNYNTSRKILELMECD